jgi:Secretion system C-terminal sorting domain
MRAIILVFLTIYIHSHGQNQANIWYFGSGAGLDFNNTCTPTVLTDGQIDGFEGCATISDKTTGELLFYTNSSLVWNRNHEIMSNDPLVSNGNTITQVIIFEKPLSDSIYYIVTSEVQGFSGEGLRVHEVNMNLNGGLGDLVYTDSLLYASPMTEKITAVRHANGTDLWLLAHKYNSNEFLSFLITASGIALNPVVSAVGKFHYSQSSVDAIGEMKVSPKGSKLAVVTTHHPDIELFDFDNATGLVTNPIILPENGGFDGIGNSSGLYGLSFSPTGSVLYASKWSLQGLNVPGQIIQYDISSNDSVMINNSRVNVFTSANKSYFSLKLGPDRKIYVGQHNSIYIGVIENPDSTGLGCNYIDNGIDLDGNLSGWGLNNLMEYDYYCEATPDFIDNTIKEIKIQLYPNPADKNITLQIDGLYHQTYILNLYNSIGELVLKTENISSGKIQIERPDFECGLFFYELVSQGQIVKTGKIIFE